jgi:hypothetical protein
MKKIQLFLVAAMIVAAASAFTTKAKVFTEYYTLDGENFAVKGDGTCDIGGLYCTYNAIVENPALDNPADFEPASTSGHIWSPATK